VERVRTGAKRVTTQESLVREGKRTPSPLKQFGSAGTTHVHVHHERQRIATRQGTHRHGAYWPDKPIGWHIGGLVYGGTHTTDLTRYIAFEVVVEKHAYGSAFLVRVPQRRHERSTNDRLVQL
jgi:hypothetical protein